MDFVDLLDQMNVHLNSIDSLSFAVLGIQDGASDKDFDNLNCALNYHVEKIREICNAYYQANKKKASGSGSAT